MLCLCGCSREAPSGKSFIRGHNLRKSARIEGRVVPYAEGKPREVILAADTAPVGEYGTHGTSIWGKNIREDYLKDFQTLSTFTPLIQKMSRSDGTIQALLLSMKLPVLSARWFIEPASEEPQDLEIAEFVSENLFGGMTVSFNDFLFDALTFLEYGFSIFEKVFEEENGKVRWRKLASRLQSTLDGWEFDEHGGPEGLYQNAPPNYKVVYIPIGKALVFTYQKTGGNLQGVSVLRSAYKHWLIKDNLYRLEAIGLERMAVGVPVMKLPPRSSSADVTKAQDIVTKLRADEEAGVVMPDIWELDILRTSTETGTINFQRTIQHHDVMIAKSALAQFLNLGSEGTGTYSLSEDQTGLFLSNLNAVADELAETISDYAIQQLVKYNWADVEDFPRLTHSDIGERDLLKLARVWDLLHPLLSVDPAVETLIRNQFGLPELTPGEEPPTIIEEEPEEEESHEPVA